MAAEGWIKIHRKITDNPVYKNAELFQLFVHCLIRANHKETKIVFNGAELKIKKGQFITGRFELAKEINQNPKSVYNRLKILEKLGILDIKPNNRFSLISIVKYSSYQDSIVIDGHKTGQHEDNTRTTRGQLEDTDKNDKNEKNKNSFVLPSKLEGIVTQELWEKWGKFRKEIRKPLTETSIELQIEFLLKQSNPSGCIEKSIMNRWQGLFETKETDKPDPAKPRYGTPEELLNAFGERG